MNIQYANYVASDYFYYKNPDNENFFFCSTDKFSPNWKKTIVLSKDYENAFDEEFTEPSTNITAEFLNSKNLNDVLTFTKKYGTLINTKLFSPNYSETHNASALSGMVHAECNLDKNCAYDLMLYEHFLFYQYELFHLQQLHSKLASLSSNANSASFFLSLLNATVYLLINPYLDLFCHIEYLEPSIDTIVDDNFPYFKLRYELNKNLKTNHEPVDQYLRKAYPIIEDSNKISETFYSLIYEIISMFFDYDEKTFPNIFSYPLFEEYFSYEKRCMDNDYWLKSKKLIIQFAESVFNEILSFHLKDIHPLSKFSIYSTELCWHFPSLAHAIFFDFYVKINENSTYKICANERCNKIFLYTTENSPRKKYCSDRCAHNAANRRSIRKKRQQLKSKSNV